MKILIVDDNEKDRKYLRMNLEHHEVESILEACDGQEGLELAKNEKPDLIISDALMPNVDGFQFLRNIKQHEVLRSIPFIFYSSVYTGHKEEELAVSLGAEAFIVKPKEPEELWNEISNIHSDIKIKRFDKIPKSFEKEDNFLRQYNQIVVTKLEEKVTELTKEIAERKRTEEELRQYKEKLEEMVDEKIKDLIIANKKLNEEILEREKYANSLLESKIILDSIADGVFTTDDQYRIISMNQSAENILGYDHQSMIGKRYDEIFKMLEMKSIFDEKISSGNKIINENVHILVSSGKVLPINISTTTLINNNGDKQGFACTFRDISELENLRKEMTQDHTFQGMVTKNVEMLNIFNMLPDIANSDCSILIEGPTGTGKNLLAEAVHNLSARKNKPFVLINCGTMPPELVESELFGYIKGAFTDAKTDKSGKISLADSGTVFFDEIGDLPISLQVKILRLIEDHQYEPVGSTKTVSTDIRVIAATNKNVAELVKSGKFRDDLFYRLSTVKLFSLPLNKRKEDIPHLIEHFIKKFNIQKGKNITGMSNEAMEIMKNYSYPGNIRELSNILEYSYITCKGNIISVTHLPKELTAKSLTEDISGEKEKIIEVLKKHNGNKTKASHELNIAYITLFRKMKKYGIEY